MIKKYTKRRRFSLFALMLFLFSVSGMAQTRDPLADLKLPNTTILSVETVAAGAFTLPPGAPTLPFPLPSKGLPAFRRVIGVINPTGDSEIKFEVWLPVASWNGNFRGVGNGGFAGSISYYDMASPLARGYAVASTDTGHTDTGNIEAWVKGHPERVIDFGFRAIHEMTVKGKAVVKAAYGKPPKFSYFGACSGGGRQALMEAQRYPEDYDGIIAGAPANYWTLIMTHGAFVSQTMLSDRASYIPAVKMKAIETAALDSCDKVDGLKDGVIDDPTRCQFNPEVLFCKGAESDSCLTAPQIAGLNKIYGGLKDSKGKIIFPGLLPGGETGLIGWESWVSGSAPGKSAMSDLAGQFFRTMVYEDQGWDFKTMNTDQAAQLANEKFAQILNAIDPNLTAFRKRGGKLIMYHGWSDAAIAPVNSINYYTSVVGKMGRRESDAFLRLYMVPGLQHCAFGPGPNNFGQILGCVPCDPRHDIYTALERWVEKGSAPDAITATKFENDSVPVKPARTRPLCPYPQVAKYKGSGSIDDARNFSCANPVK